MYIYSSVLGDECFFTTHRQPVCYITSNSVNISKILRLFVIFKLCVKVKYINIITMHFKCDLKLLHVTTENYWFWDKLIVLLIHSTSPFWHLLLYLLFWWMEHLIFVNLRRSGKISIASRFNGLLLDNLN